ncbi:MAG: hypothetical protein KIT79_07575 [Deltaproteobacteria bacterium]|nr:hypothetical protein [Deltaproteobacteria bacterium]
MNKAIVCLAIAIIPVTGCQRRETSELRERVIKLENKIADLEERQSQTPVVNPEDAKRRQLENLIAAFNRLEEQSYKDDSKVKAGEGSLEVIVTPREGPSYMQARMKPDEAEGIAGVTVRVAETKLPVVNTAAKGSVFIGNLKAGNYTVELDKAGYQKKLFPVEVREGKRKSLVTFMLKEGEEIGAAAGGLLQGLSGQGGAPAGNAGANGGENTSEQIRDFLGKLQEAAARQQRQSQEQP